MKTKSTLFFFAFALWVNINTVNAQVNVQDSLALVDLYNSTDGANWKHNDKWLTINSVSTWYGITVSNTRVTQINLGSNNLNGNIPSSIANLADLAWLSLPHNKVGGDIPASIGNLVFYDLDLSDNHLTDSIPSIRITENGEMNLSHNELSGTIPLNIPTEAYYIDLSYNRLTFDGMELLAKLAYNDYKDYEFSPQANIPLHQNADTLTVYAGGTLSKNTYTWHSFEQNSYIIKVADSAFHPSGFGNYSATVTNVICGFTLYTDIVLYGASDIIHDSLALVDVFNNTNGPNWKNRTNWLTSNPISSWYGITVSDGRVSAISLENNGLDGNIPISIDYLQKLSLLQLDNNDLQGNIPATFGNLPHSLSVHLSNNQFTFEGMEVIARAFPNAIYAPQKVISIQQNGSNTNVQLAMRHPACCQ